MPRFSTRFMLVVVAVVALWLSTIMGYRAAYEVQTFIRLGILVASGVAAVSCEGRRRAFWAGFFITVWTLGIDGKLNIGRFWIALLLNSYGLFQNLPNGYPNTWFKFFDATLQAVVLLLIATVMGFIGILVHKYCERSES